MKDVARLNSSAGSTTDPKISTCVEPGIGRRSGSVALPLSSLKEKLGWAGPSGDGSSSGTVEQTRQLPIEKRGGVGRSLRRRHGG